MHGNGQPAPDEDGNDVRAREDDVVARAAGHQFRQQRLVVVHRVEDDLAVVLSLELLDQLRIDVVAPGADIELSPLAAGS